MIVTSKREVKYINPLIKERNLMKALHINKMPDTLRRDLESIQAIRQKQEPYLRVSLEGAALEMLNRGARDFLLKNKLSQGKEKA